MSPDRLRMNPQAVEFVERFAQAGQTITAICHRLSLKLMRFLDTPLLFGSRSRPISSMLGRCGSIKKSSTILCG